MFKYFIVIVFILFISTEIVIGANRKHISSIPMSINMGAPSIEVFINDKGPFQFDFDTGALGSMISNELAETLSLDTVSETIVMSPASSEGIKTDVVLVQEIAISDIELKNIQMTKLDFKGILGGVLETDGILSLNDFSDFLVTFNYPEEVMQFEKGFLNENDKNVTSFWGQIMNVEIEVNGEKKNAHFDIGFQGSFAFPYNMRNSLNLKSPPIEFGSAKMVGTSFKIYKADLDGKIMLGNTVFDSPEIILEERNSDNIVIGYQAMKNLIITIDKQNNLLQLEKKFTLKKDASILPDANHEFAGRYGGVRSIIYEEGILYIQRDGSMKLILEKSNSSLFKMVLPDGMIPANTLPDVRFDRNDNSEVYRLTFIHKDGREEYSLKE